MELYKLLRGHAVLNLLRRHCSAIAESVNTSVLSERPVELLAEPVDVALNLKPSYNLAAYVNKSETLQELIKLGVNLHKIEKKKPELAELVLGLNFEQDVKPYLMFLHDCGVPSDQLGEHITKNPAIFKEDLDNLSVRINYLESKKFKADEIARIVTKNPFWLMFTTQGIDTRLGFFQKQFTLSGAETRSVAISQPRLITYRLEHVRKSTFTILEEMGFDKAETKQLLLTVPKLWMLDFQQTVEKFDYMHNQMGISHKRLVDDPNVLLSRRFRIEQRDKFLRYLGKAQYDPKKDLYVSLTDLVSGNDEEFVLNVAKSNFKTYETFLKSQ